MRTPDHNLSSVVDCRQESQKPKDEERQDEKRKVMVETRHRKEGGIEDELTVVKRM